MQIKILQLQPKAKGQLLARNASEKPRKGKSARVEKTDLQPGTFFSQATEENPLLIFLDRHDLKG